MPSKQYQSGSIGEAFRMSKRPGWSLKSKGVYVARRKHRSGKGSGRKALAIPVETMVAKAAKKRKKR